MNQTPSATAGIIAVRVRRSPLEIAVVVGLCCAVLAVASVAWQARVHAFDVDTNGTLDVAVRGEAVSLATEPAKVTLISDSALAGIRWYGQLHHLTGTRWESRLESCRRVHYPSCRGREGYAPRTLVGELNAIAAAGGVGPNEVLLVSVGHNDWESRFRWDLHAALSAARRAGFSKVGWLNYRENVSYTLPGSAADTLRANYAAMNGELRRAAASGEWPELVLVDYGGYTAFQSGWFTRDGVHLTSAGSAAIARWLSSEIRFANTPAFAPLNWHGRN